MKIIGKNAVSGRKAARNPEKPGVSRALLLPHPGKSPIYRVQFMRHGSGT
jgi:hypothetical protein